MTQAEKYAIDTIGHKPGISEPQVYGEYLLIRDAFAKGYKSSTDKACEWMRKFCDEMKDTAEYWSEEDADNIYDDFRKFMEEQ